MEKDGKDLQLQIWDLHHKVKQLIEAEDVGYDEFSSLLVSNISDKSLPSDNLGTYRTR